MDGLGLSEFGFVFGVCVKVELVYGCIGVVVLVEIMDFRLVFRV